MQKHDLLEELRRLDNNVTPRHDPMPHQLIVRVKIRCNGNANRVHERVKSLLTIVAKTAINRFPGNDEWTKILPSWFIATCAKPRDMADASAMLAKWRTMSPQEQAAFEKDVQWALDEWVDWFRPENRQWLWWGSELQSSNLFIVDILVGGLPFPSGALEWLLKACGAVNISFGA